MFHQRKYIIWAFLIFSFVFVGIYFIMEFGAKRNAMWCGTESNYALIEYDTTREYKEGKILFINKCASCHILFKDFVGPDLIGLTKRGPWVERNNILMYLRNPLKFYEENKSKYVDSLKMKNSAIDHQIYLLNDKEVNDFVYYIQAEEKNKKPYKP